MNYLEKIEELDTDFSLALDAFKLKAQATLKEMGGIARALREKVPHCTVMYSYAVGNRYPLARPGWKSKTAEAYPFVRDFALYRAEYERKRAELEKAMGESVKNTTPNAPIALNGKNKRGKKNE